jgi:uncharacterized phage protein (TIGR01671 family)
MGERGYRAWDTELKRYWYGWDPAVIQAVVFHHPRYIAEQSIGRLDSKGKDIHEGDIVKLTNPINQLQKAEIIGLVIYSFASYGVEVKKITVWEGYRVPPPETGGVLWFLMGAKKIEVIGNIHETPELIEEAPIDSI